jgi:hypothetical protein
MGLTQLICAWLGASGVGEADPLAFGACLSATFSSTTSHVYFLSPAYATSLLRLKPPLQTLSVQSLHSFISSLTLSSIHHLQISQGSGELPWLRKNGRKSRLSPPESGFLTALQLNSIRLTALSLLIILSLTLLSYHQRLH